MSDYSKGKIYKINNTKNEKVYIGSTTEDLKTRLRRHRYNTKQNKQVAMTEPINTLGEENFNIELLEEYPCNSKTELENMENFWIGFFIGYLGRDNVYNIMIDNKTSNETKNKLSIQFSGVNNPAFNRGTIYKPKDCNSYKFQYGGDNNRLTKYFNFNKYGGEENALKEAEKFRDTMFPPN